MALARAALRDDPRPAPASLADCIGADGRIVVERAAESVGLAKGELALSLGLAPEALYKTARAQAPRTQARLRDLLEIVDRVTPWAGGRPQAVAWYRAQPLAAFGDRTAEALVKSGEAAALRDYLDHLALGGFA
jgi:hypothetical protein